MTNSKFEMMLAEDGTNILHHKESASRPSMKSSGASAILFFE
jgi:hypothetical protein